MSVAMAAQHTHQIPIQNYYRENPQSSYELNKEILGVLLKGGFESPMM
jgi:hypothetical protein